MMSYLRKVTAGLLAMLLVVAVWSTASRSQDERVRAPNASQRTSTGARPVSRAASPAPQASAAKTMSGEEKLVRDVYARLMRYQSAAVDELLGQAGKSGAPDDYLTFELRNIRSGSVAEILDRQLEEMAAAPGDAVISLKPVYLSGEGEKAEQNALSHAYYEAEWSAAPARSAQSSAVKNVPSGFDRYTSYDVRVRLQGKQATYRALAVYQFQKSGRPEGVQFFDNVALGLNTVYADESPRVHAPWHKYVKTSLYQAVVRTIKEARNAGASLIPADAPIGYLPGDDVVPTDADSSYMAINAVCPPNVQLKLKEVGWGGSGQIAMKKKGSGSPGSDWENDPYAADGNTAIENPVWIDTDTNGSPNENEPVAYIKGSSPQLTGAKITITPALTTSVNAKVKVESGTALRFGVKDVVLTGSSFTLPTFTTSDNVGSVVNNRDYDLHWSVSFDNGQSFTEFAVSTHKAFVTIAAPTGYLANDGVTAKRIDRVTTTAQGKSNLVEIAQTISASVAGDPGFSLNFFIEDNAGNHWRALDDDTACDCISLSILAVKQLRMLGISATHNRAYPTGGNPAGDTNAGASEFDATGRQLDFFAAGGANVFEGFFEIADGTTRKAFTVDPVQGPILASTLNVSGDKVFYNVIKTTLENIRAGNPSGNGGKQYWFSSSTGLDFSHPVPFPVP